MKTEQERNAPDEMPARIEQAVMKALRSTVAVIPWSTGSVDGCPNPETVQIATGVLLRKEKRIGILTAGHVAGAVQRAHDMWVGVSMPERLTGWGPERRGDLLRLGRGEIVGRGLDRKDADGPEGDDLAWIELDRNEEQRIVGTGSGVFLEASRIEARVRGVDREISLATSATTTHMLIGPPREMAHEDDIFVTALGLESEDELYAEPRLGWGGQWWRVAGSPSDMRAMKPTMETDLQGRDWPQEWRGVSGSGIWAPLDMEIDAESGERRYPLIELTGIVHWYEASENGGRFRGHNIHGIAGLMAEVRQRRPVLGEHRLHD